MQTCAKVRPTYRFEISRVENRSNEHTSDSPALYVLTHIRSRPDADLLSPQSRNHYQIHSSAQNPPLCPFWLVRKLSRTGRCLGNAWLPQRSGQKEGSEISWTTNRAPFLWNMQMFWNPTWAAIASIFTAPVHTPKYNIYEPCYLLVYEEFLENRPCVENW